MNLEFVVWVAVSWLGIACLIFFMNEMVYSSASFNGYNLVGKILLAPLLFLVFVLSMPGKLLEDEADT